MPSITANPSPVRRDPSREPLVPKQPAPANAKVTVHQGSCIQSVATADAASIHVRPQVHVSDGAPRPAKNMTLIFIAFALVNQATAESGHVIGAGPAGVDASAVFGPAPIEGAFTDDQEPVRIYTGARTTSPELPCTELKRALEEEVTQDPSMQPDETRTDGLRFLPPQGHTLGNVHSVREFARDARWAGIDRIIVAGAGNPEVLYDVLNGAGAPGDLDYYKDIDMPVARPSRQEDDLGAPPAMPVEFRKLETAKNHPFFAKNTKDTVLYTQVQRAAGCKPNGVGYRLDCVEGEVIPPIWSRTPDPELYAKMYDLYSSANAHELPAMLVIPEEHWSSSGEFLLEKLGKEREDSRRSGLPWVSQVGTLFLNLVGNHFGHEINPPNIPGRMVLMASVSAGISLADFGYQKFLQELFGEPTTHLAPNRGQFMNELTKDGKNIALEVAGESGRMTFIFPEQFRDLVETFHAANQAPPGHATSAAIINSAQTQQPSGAAAESLPKQEL